MSEQKLQANPRGIPQSPFVVSIFLFILYCKEIIITKLQERVEDYVSEAEPVEVVLKKFQEAIR
jgi:hypothetical protein